MPKVQQAVGSVHSPSQGTAAASWAQLILRAAASEGVAASVLLDARELARLDAARPLERVPWTLVDKIWTGAIRALGDETFPLRLARYLGPSALGALGHAMASSETVGEALRRCALYHPLMSTAIAVRLEHDAAEWSLVATRLVEAEGMNAAIEAATAVICGQVRALHPDDPVSPLAVHLRRPPPARPEDFERELGAKVFYRATFDRVTFTAAAAARTVPGACSIWAAETEAAILRALGSQTAPDTSSRVRQAMVQMLLDGPPNERDVARRLGMSVRTLQSRLTEESTSYRGLLDETRRGLALTYLGGGAYSVKEVAFRLGFSSPASFSRAFKRWTGATPTRWAKAPRR